MKLRNNEQGYALLLVLGLVLIFVTLGLTLLAMNINASKQFTVKGENVQARHFAEMGVLHYRTEIKEWLKSQNYHVDEGIDVCQQLITADDVEDPAGSGRYIKHFPETYNYDISINPDDCTEEDDQITIVYNSAAVSGSQGKANIDARLFLKKAESVPAVPPQSESEEKICVDLPVLGEICTTIASDVLDLTTLLLKKEELLITDNVVVEKLKVNGGASANLTVAKDLYVKNLLEVQTHACIVVEGDFTVLNKITSTNKLYIFVYGDANLPSSIVHASQNNGIFVKGDVYVNGEKQDPKMYPSQPPPGLNHGCTLPDNPPEGNPDRWILEDGVDAIYQ